MALTEKLTAIADAIRGKTGKAEEMTLEQMAAEIAGITAGGGSSEAFEFRNDIHSLHIKTVTTGANTVTNSSNMIPYFQGMIDGDLQSVFIVDNPPYGIVNNQLLGWYGVNYSANHCLRFRDGAYSWFPYNSAGYDVNVAEGSKYVLVSWVNPTV